MALTAWRGKRSTVRDTRRFWACRLTATPTTLVPVREEGHDESMTAKQLRVVMMGTGQFAVPIFAAVLGEFRDQLVGLVTQPLRSGGQRRSSTRLAGHPLATLAAEYGVPVIQPESINTPQACAVLEQWQPDLFVVAAYGQILSPQVLAIPRLGAVNVHASLLPRYRGAAPVAHAILQGDSHTGVTLIRMTPQLDAGDILAQQVEPIRPDDTAGSLEARLAELGAQLTVALLRRLMAGEMPQAIPQDPAQATRAPKLRKQSGLIDWGQSPQYLERFVRAMQPWPTAFTFLHQPGRAPLRLIVTRLVPGPVLTTTAELPPAGTIYRASQIAGSDTPLAVCTGTPQLALIEELQPAGKRRMTAAEFVRGHPLGVHDRLGPENLDSPPVAPASSSAVASSSEPSTI